MSAYPDARRPIRLETASFMTTATPATTLHDVVVTHEQTRAQWRAGSASIVGGRIVVTARTAPPAGMFDHPAGTYDIIASDGGDRLRHFPSVTFDRDASKPPKRFVFL